MIATRIQGLHSTRRGCAGAVRGVAPCVQRRQAPARNLKLHAADVATVAPPTEAAPPPPITVTEKALEHLKKLKAEMKNSDPGALLLRVGVKSGGCSGMSYQMDFEDRSKICSDDMVVPYDDGSLELVINPKSLLFLFGMNLDYSDALIGGGFQFQNPNAVDSCGCGKSFGV